MPPNVESMFSKVTLPWWTGTSYDEGQARITDRHPESVDELLTWSGLDWTVSQRPMFTLSDLGMQKLAKHEADPGYEPAFELDDVIQMVNEDEKPNLWANVRDSDNSTLGSSGNIYELFQPRDCAELAMAVLRVKDNGDYMADFETGGSLRGGRSIWFLARINRERKLKDGTTPLPFLLTVNSFDGSSAARCIQTNVRAECENTVNFALSSAKTSWTMKHAGSIHDQAAEARESLALAGEAYDRYVDVSNQLLTRKFTKKDQIEVVADLYPLPTNVGNLTDKEQEKLQARREKVLDVILHSPNLDDVRSTAYGTLQGIVEYVDHGRSYKKPESRMLALATGVGPAVTMKQQAASIVSERAGVKL